MKFTIVALGLVVLGIFFFTKTVVRHDTNISLEVLQAMAEDDSESGAPCGDLCVVRAFPYGVVYACKKVPKESCSNSVPEKGTLSCANARQCYCRFCN